MSDPEQQPYANFQYEIYAGGLAGQGPEFPVDSTGWEQAFREAVPAQAHDYVAGAAGSEDTLRANLAAFRARRIVPRMLVDVDVRDLSVTLFDTPLPSPVLLAPIGVQGIVHEQGELASARGAAGMGVPIVLSTAATRSMEDVAAALRRRPALVPALLARSDRELAASLVGRAERAGYGALVVTLDTLSSRGARATCSTAYLPFLTGRRARAILQRPGVPRRLERTPEEDPAAAVGLWVGSPPNPSLTWDDLAWLREQTAAADPAQGHPAPRRRAQGGRRRDGRRDRLQPRRPPGRWRDRGARRPAGVVDAVRRPASRSCSTAASARGADVVKALALGARAILLGPPLRVGPGRGRRAGRARRRCAGLLADLDLTLALSGHRSVAELGPGLLA